MIYDITPRITGRTMVWPGDTPLTRTVVCDMARGANITLSAIGSTVHLGAHADGPNHYSHPAEGVGERSLAYFLGRCQVIDVTGVARGGRVRPADLRSAVREARVLLRTGTFDGFEAWNSDFAGLCPSLVAHFAAAAVSAGEAGVAARGVVTVGVDTPSVDVQESKDLPAHRAIAAAGMQILEGLDLRGVDEGVYELIALPLRLVGWDASPVRAVLRTV